MTTMTEKAERIMLRYTNGYVTDSQLGRYLALDVITQAEYDEIYTIKHPVEGEVE